MYAEVCASNLLCRGEFPFWVTGFTLGELSWHVGLLRRSCAPGFSIREYFYRSSRRDTYPFVSRSSIYKLKQTTQSRVHKLPSFIHINIP